MPQLFIGHSKSSKIRIWFKEDIILQGFDRENGFVDTVVSHGEKIIEQGSCAIEVFHHIGPTIRYGLLGIEIRKSTTDDFSVNFPIASYSVKNIGWNSLAGSLDDISVGGAKEYSSSIVAGIEELGVDAPSKGTLYVTHMVQGARGSSPHLFKSLSKAAIRIITRHCIPTSFDEAYQLLE